MATNNLLPKDAIDEFKRLYMKIFNVELSDDEAVRMANNLFLLYEAVYGNS